MCICPENLSSMELRGNGLICWLEKTLKTGEHSLRKQLWSLQRSHPLANTSCAGTTGKGSWGKSNTSQRFHLMKLQVYLQGESLEWKGFPVPEEEVPQRVIWRCQVADILNWRKNVDSLSIQFLLSLEGMGNATLRDQWKAAETRPWVSMSEWPWEAIV